MIITKGLNSNKLVTKGYGKGIDGSLVNLSLVKEDWKRYLRYPIDVKDIITEIEIKGIKKIFYVNLYDVIATKKFLSDNFYNINGIKEFKILNEYEIIALLEILKQNEYDVIATKKFLSDNFYNINGIKEFKILNEYNVFSIKNFFINENILLEGIKKFQIMNNLDIKGKKDIINILEFLELI